MKKRGNRMNININDLNQDISRALHEQYGAALEMFEIVIKSCTVELWDDRINGPPFWHIAFHTLWYLDWYLVSTKEERKAFKARYEIVQPGLERSPEEVLTKDQLMLYLLEIKKKAKERLEHINMNELVQPSIYEWHGNSILSSLIYNLRHLMLHIGALNSRVLRRGVKLDNWVSNALISLNKEQ
jgi:hypothetical protein